jgi:hypothetical protein
MDSDNHLVGNVPIASVDTGESIIYREVVDDEPSGEKG